MSTSRDMTCAELAAWEDLAKAARRLREAQRRAEAARARAQNRQRRQQRGASDGQR